MPDIILATRNPGKAEQVRAMFQGSSWTIQTMAEAGVVGEAVENGLTLAQNALAKTLFVSRELPTQWVMGEDTGLFIYALNGEPGGRTARWAGEHATTEEIMRYALHRLAGHENRFARFRTVVVVAQPSGLTHTFEGWIYGTILCEPQGTPPPKLPYSAIFLPYGSDKTLAQMTPEELRALTHRGKAFQKVRAFLECRGEQ